MASEYSKKLDLQIADDVAKFYDDSLGFVKYIPNLEIPPDKNIINFKIDPAYVKNGTLDGKVGLVNDPDYPNADFERGSYFKPLEAYKLKAQIEKQTLDLSAYYEQFDVAKGKSKQYDVTYAEGLLSDLENKLFVNRNDPSTVRKSLVNTYVWTADGGLHAEQEQFADQKQMTYSGFRKELNTAGLSLSDKALFGAVQIGPTASFDYLGGQQVDVTVSKAKTENTGFGLALTVTGDPILLGWNQDPAPGFYSTSPCPGKVTSYRFNAFYLAPSTKNADVFNQIVDKNWLRSDDPNAIALRSANVTGTSVWRVLYRVTYVSRVPPAFDNAPDQTVAPQYTRTIDVNDNANLIAFILVQLGQQSVTPENVGNAIAAVLPPYPNNGVYPLSILGTVLSWWEPFLATTRPGSTYNAAAAAWLVAFRFDPVN